MNRIIVLVILALACSAVHAQQSSDEALAAQYFQAGEFDKAALIYEKLYSRTKNQGHYDPYFTALLKTKQYDKAEDLAKKLLKANPGNYTYAVDIGRVIQEKGEQEKAVEWFNKLVREMPANEFAIKDLAITFYRAEGYDFSIKTLLNGRKLLNDENIFSFDLISLYRYRKDKPMLVQEYLSLLSKSPEILPQAQNVLANILEDRADYDMLKTALLRRLQKDAQNIAYTELLTWQYVQQKEFDMALRQTFALDRRLKEDGSRVFDLSRLLLSNHAYTQAIEALNYLIAKGADGRYYIPAKIDLLDAKTAQLRSNKFTREDMLALEADYLSLLSEFGRNAGTSRAIRQLANLQAFYLHKAADAARQLSDMIGLPGVPPLNMAQAKLELGDIYILTGEVWEAVLLYGQVEKQFSNDIYGQEAKYRSAKLSYFQGDYVWSKAQLDVLKSSTSQLIANDALNLSLLISDNLQNETDTAALKKYSYADLLVFKNQPDEALQLLDSLNMLYPGNSLADDILMTKAKIFLKKNETDKGVTQLVEIMEKYGSDLWGDDAIFMLADTYENKLGQPAKALELYQKIITDYPGSLFVIEARKRFRLLRGDKLG
jgi:lipopolysaccharide biosynthesis regulator YciM/outer membrane protein assembly factor BamD (BamD/ComL family)